MQMRTLKERNLLERPRYLRKMFAREQGSRERQGDNEAMNKSEP